MNRWSLQRRQLLAASLFSLASCGAFAQAWPAKPLRLVVAGPAGGNADLVARLVAEPLARELGQPVVVDNKPGGAGAIAIGEVLQAPRDGYTLLVGVNSLVSEIPHIVKLRWDVAKEIKPLAELGRGGLVLVGHPSVPAKNVPELVAYAKANPGKLNYASYSPGTLSHVLGLQLNQAAGIQLTHVGYKGSAPALADVMGNHVPLMFDGLGSSLPLIKSGKVKAFAVSAPRRVPQLPDVPTFHELGYPQLDALAWMGLWSTPDVPAPVQARVREAALKVLANADVRARMLDTGLEAGLPRTPEEMAKGLKTDYDRVGGVLQSIGFKPE
ncbi:tripartite tricarboxylate transporter substrate binding protein [Ramlibacter sp. USB13]|uniref:Tripartite tricarboxylate transporter substrate binding protein n=1 Tax=Ramlibacter cellulosilyticus TaxID=2764187 RepID=A0A923MYQ5_9BURK|nr:tripartite tricarboxylate transporter substrate binding protein [Ramlibacter cellulosilyticus]MBC5786142.1 tripartite tricarboxylate transporter substrate binding protein [Ramlibacter cellulosilyticus]